MPVSLSVASELSGKLDADIRLTFDRMFASDLSGRAQAFQSLVLAGIDPGKAANMAGLMESRVDREGALILQSRAIYGDWCAARGGADGGRRLNVGSVPSAHVTPAGARSG